MNSTNASAILPAMISEILDTDDGLPPALCRAGRALLGWSIDELAAAAGVSRRVIVLLENGHRAPKSSTVAQITAAFAAERVSFVWTEAGTGVVRKPEFLEQSRP